MSSAFQLSSAYRPYRSPTTESSTIEAGMSDQDRGDQHLAGPAVGERGRVAGQQRPQRAAAHQALEHRHHQHPGQQVTHEPQLQQGAEGQPDDDQSDTGRPR